MCARCFRSGKLDYLGGGGEGVRFGGGHSFRIGGHKVTYTELTYAPVSQVIATNLSSLFDLLLRSTPKMRAECCLELTAVNGYRMFLGPFG